jgi:anaerobic ribonucleoside-triphosphate reductase
MKANKSVKPKISVGRAVPCEVYSRIVGYFRPTGAWNDGKRREFRDRATFNVLEEHDDGRDV